MYKVLDMGSGLVPDIRATDAIDISTDRAFLKHEEAIVIDQVRDLGKREKIKQLQDFRNKNIKLIRGVNFNRHLPYPDNTFNLVVSLSALAPYGKDKAYAESYRVLKSGGILEVGAASLPQNWVKHIQTFMEKNGFENIKIKRRLPDTRLFHVGNKDVIYGKKR